MRRIGDEEGFVLVTTALLATTLVLSAAIALDYGRSVWTQESAENAARTGAESGAAVYRATDPRPGRGQDQAYRWRLAVEEARERAAEYMRKNGRDPDRTSIEVYPGRLAGPRFDLPGAQPPIYDEICVRVNYVSEQWFIRGVLQDNLGLRPVASWCTRLFEYPPPPPPPSPPPTGSDIREPRERDIASPPPGSGRGWERVATFRDPLTGERIYIKLRDRATDCTGGRCGYDIISEADYEAVVQKVGDGGDGRKGYWAGSIERLADGTRISWGVGVDENGNRYGGQTAWKDKNNDGRITRDEIRLDY